MLETCQLVIDRPQSGDAAGLMYVAEPVGARAKGDIATSPVFHPDLDPTAHRAALVQIEADLRAQGWQRDATHRGLVGARFVRTSSSSNES